MQRAFYLLTFCFLVTTGQENERKFPDDFLFGTATGSYQIEGGWDADDKGENIWDYLTHTRPEYIDDRNNGDVACDTYHKYKRDVEMMRELNSDAFRLSISWSRILPTGFSNRVSDAGIEFYNNFIDEMLKFNITPFVTIYHWDLPQPLQDLGGWTNPYIADWFTDYSKVLFEHFGDRVKLWTTFNEPQNICYQGYGMAAKAPALNASGIADYLCYRNLLLAHAKTYHLYNNDFKPNQGGQIGMASDLQYYKPESDSEEDEKIAQTVRDFMTGIFMDPVHLESGDYPESVKEIVSAKSKEQGFFRSRLIPFSEEERDYIRGTYDFVGINHYTSRVVYRNESTIGLYPSPHMLDDYDFDNYQDPSWVKGTNWWQVLDSTSLYNVLKYIRERYNNPDVYITENGWATTGGVDDEGRINYIRTHLNGVLDAMSEGSNVKAFMARSLMDNFHWFRGYSENFGLYGVDFEDPERTRTPRKSAFVYKEIVRSRVIDPDFNPDDSVPMWIEEGH